MVVLLSTTIGKGTLPCPSAKCYLFPVKTSLTAVLTPPVAL